MRPALIPATVLLLLAAACQPRADQTQPYGATEEGLTLAYEDPSLPQPQRSQQRLQVRVARTKVKEDGTTLVQLDYTSLRGSLSLLLQHRGGGIALLAPDGRPMAQLLPTGFPEVGAWRDRGAAFRVLGRATWDGARLLGPDRSPVGVWVEARPLNGVPRRSLYVPGVGEVESQELQGTTWVTVNRLVSLGFTELPSTPSRP